MDMDEIELLARGPLDVMVRTLQDMGSPAAARVAFSALARNDADRLKALGGAGFDLSALHQDDLAVETLLHRVVRLHPYEDPAAKLGMLLELGADPHCENAQGLTVLGLLSMRSKDMPTHRVAACLQSLHDHGVSLLGSCGRGELARFLLKSSSAMENLEHCCPEVLPWAQALLLSETTPSAARQPRPRF